MVFGNSKIYAQGFLKSWFGRDDGKAQKVSSSPEKPRERNDSRNETGPSERRSGSILRTESSENYRNSIQNISQPTDRPGKEFYGQEPKADFRSERVSGTQQTAFETSQQRGLVMARPVSNEIPAGNLGSDNLADGRFHFINAKSENGSVASNEINNEQRQNGISSLNSRNDNFTGNNPQNVSTPQNISTQQNVSTPQNAFNQQNIPSQQNISSQQNTSPVPRSIPNDPQNISQGGPSSGPLNSMEAEGMAVSGLSSSAGLPGAASLAPDQTGSAMETLEQAWSIALEESRRLQASGFTTSAARKQVDSARGLAMPKLANNTSAVTMSEQESVTSQVSFLGMSFAPETKPLDKDFVYSVTALTVPLYLGGKVRGMVDAAKATTAALEAGQLTNEQDLKSEVTKMYFLVLRVRSLLKVAEEAERTIASHEKDATRMFENGLLTKNVVLSAQVAHANATQDVLKARNSLHLVEAAYNRLLWRPLQTPVNIQEIGIPSASGDLESLQAQAVAKRSELSSLASTASALSSQVQVHRGTRLPNVSLIGAHSYLESENLHPNSNLTGAISMVWMPFDGGTSRAQEESAKFQALAVARMREDAKTAIELQVYQAWLNESETRERLLVMEKAVQQADENMRVVSRKFHEGLVNHTEVLDAQTQRTLVWNNYEHAKYDTIQAVFDLRRALGGL